MSHESESVSEAEVSFVVIRANGDREELGTQYWSSNPLRRLLYKIRGWKD